MAHRAYRATVTIIVAAAALGAAGCARIRNHQGYVADSALVQAVQPGVDNRESVMKTLGRPSFTSEFDKSAWYYVSRDTRQFGPNRPKPKEQMLLIVHFDPQGNVSQVEKRGLEKVVDVHMNGDKTPTLGRHTNLFDDLFGNIGAVGAGGGAGAAGGGGQP